MKMKKIMVRLSNCDFVTVLVMIYIMLKEGD